MLAQVHSQVASTSAAALEVQDWAFWGVFAAVGIALLVLCVLLARQHNVTRHLRTQVVGYQEGLRELTELHVPAALNPSGSLSGTTGGAPRPVPELDGYGERILALTRAAAVTAARGGAQDSQAALMGVTRTLRALVTEQQSAIEQMQRAFDDPDVLAGLMDIDMTAGQLARRVVAVGVLCGSGTGIQREDTSVEQVVRGAMGRIRDHHRVEPGSPVPWAVRGPAVEAVVLVVAELLDNAARCSSPGTKVRVEVFPVDRGVVVQIDDAGVGMAPEQVERARRMLSGHLAVDVRDLGNPAQVGFPVCGVLAAQLGLVITVGRQSPFGGTQVVVLLPGELLVPEQEPVPVAVAPAPAVRSPSPSPVARTESTDGRTTPGGLPVRRRERQPSSPQQTAPETGTASKYWVAPPDIRPAVLGAWQRGTATGRGGSPGSPGATGNTTAEHRQERTS